MVMRKVMPTGLRVSALALALVLPALDRPAPGRAEPAIGETMKRVAAGRLSYRVHCASCHGEGGRGDGPMARALKVRPADLTRLAHSHSGRFPRDEVYQFIDGRRQVLGHGTAAMPVWGATFQERGSDRPQEQEVREKILDLLAYLESIQTAR